MEPYEETRRWYVRASRSVAVWNEVERVEPDWKRPWEKSGVEVNSGGCVSGMGDWYVVAGD